MKRAGQMVRSFWFGVKVGPEPVLGETRFQRRLASAAREGWGGAEHDRANSAREQAVPAKRYPAVA